MPTKKLDLSGLKKGKLTAIAKKQGAVKADGTIKKTWLTANKTNPKISKQVNFAINSSKWKKS